MLCDEGHRPIEFASLPRLHIKKHFKRPSLTIEDLNKLVRIVKPLSERFPASLRDPGRHEGPGDYSNEQFPSHPTLLVKLAVANDEVCRVQIKEDWSREIDVLDNEKFDIGRTTAGGRQPAGKMQNAMIGKRSRRNGSVSTHVVGLEEWTSVEMTSDMSLCSDDDVENMSVVMVPQSSWQAPSGSLLESEHMEKDLSAYQQYVSWKYPAISEAVAKNFDSIKCYSNSDSNRKNNKRNADKDDWEEDVLQSQKHMTSEYEYSELPERGDQKISLNKLEVERFKTKRGKDGRRHRSDPKQQLEVEDEDLLNEGWMELEKAYRKNKQHQTDEKKSTKLESAQLFHGRAILGGRCVQPLLIPLEVVSNEKHYKWKDGQLVSFMKDPRLEKHVGKKKESPALFQVSLGKLTWPAESTGIFIKSEPCADAYEIVEPLSKTSSSTSCLQSYSKKARSHGTNSITYKLKDATNGPISNVSHNAGSVQDQVAANRYLRARADGKTLESVECGACPIPVVLSKSFFSYVDDLPKLDDSELDQSTLPPDWMDEHSSEALQGSRASCGYVNEMLRNIYKCILDARVIADDVYRDTMLMESLQCIKLALNIHSNL